MTETQLNFLIAMMLQAQKMFQFFPQIEAYSGKSSVSNCAVMRSELVEMWYSNIIKINEKGVETVLPSILARMLKLGGLFVAAFHYNLRGGRDARFINKQLSKMPSVLPVLPGQPAMVGAMSLSRKVSDYKEEETWQ
ncbi:MAG: hypothetical protein K0U49_00840 [Alphaproteobacteria bacterium]|nr:hypothetical protein [Alphaproteobacteria bacterium]